ncbi:MAG TPA: hypothetical protein VEJ16_13900 [Alphaproteobacteria bacterium]|nr:hypothetical protein [Alphaproteobacteria bacterium]
MRKTACIVVALVVIPLGSLSAMEERSYGRIGQWEVIAYYNEVGVFSHCALGMASRSKQENLTLTLGAQGYFVFLDNPEWALPLDDRYRVQASIDQQIWQSSATVYSPTGVSMAFPWNVGFGAAFASGSDMSVRFSNGRSWTVALRGSNAAMPSFLKCLNENKIDRNPMRDGPGNGAQN